VNGLAEPGDIVVDMDLLASVLTVTDDEHVYSNEVRVVARQARTAAVSAALEVAASGVRTNVWVVHTNPSPDVLRRYRVANARVKVLDPGRDECLARLAERPPSTHRLARKVIDDWYRGR